VREELCGAFVGSDLTEMLEGLVELRVLVESLVSPVAGP